MRLSISHKIFLTIYATISALLALVVAGALFSMFTGFVSHVRELDEVWLTQVSATLCDVYRDSDDWREVPGDQDFARWLQQELLERRGHHGHGSHGGHSHPPPGHAPGQAGPVCAPPRPESGERLPTNPAGPADLGPPGSGNPGPGGPAGGPPRLGPPPPFGFEGMPRDLRPGPMGPPLELMGRIGLEDAQRNRLAGVSGDDERPLQVDGRLVGYLTVQTFALKPDRLHPFLKDQILHLLALGLLAMLLSILAARALARHMRGPINMLGEATHKLAGGDFKVRLESRQNDELGQLVEDFNLLARALDNQEQMRRQWVADTSHELRTPLAVLRAQIEALQDGIHKPDESTLGVLHEQVLGLQGLVEDLHQLARWDEGMPGAQMEDVALNPLLAACTDAFQERFRQRGLELSVQPAPGDPWLRADRAQLSRLLTNLTENSLRYTDAPGRLEVSATVSGKRLKLRFEDTSPGVPELYRSRLFERFFRVEASRTRERGGSGLGLSICQKIVEGHNGTIRATDSKLGGLAIEVELPCLNR